MAPARSLAGVQTATAGRRTLLRDQRTHGWPTLVGRSSTDTVPPYGRPRSSAPSLRPAPAPPCPCRRDGARGRAPECDPTPARPCGPRDHLGLSTGDREWRDR